MKIAEITGFLEKIAPPELADESDRDRIGLILDRDNEINKIATALDVTDPMLQEAARAGADLLVAHHTHIYEPVNHNLKNPGRYPEDRTGQRHIDLCDAYQL